MPRKLSVISYQSSDKEKGTVPVLVLLAAVGLIVFIVFSSSAGFKDKLFSRLFPKPPSFAAEPDEVIVKFKKQVPDTERDKVRKQHNLTKESVIESKDEEDVDEQVLGVNSENPSTATKRVRKKKLQIEVVRVPTGDRDKIIAELRKDPNVEYAEPNYIGQTQDTPNDPQYASQYALQKINISPAWDITQGSPSVVIAVIDSGVLATHADLAGKLTANGYNFYDSNINTDDVQGHGTAVAGVAAAATNNGVGIAGVGRNVKIMPLRVSDSNNTYLYSRLISAINYAADNGAKVISMSLGGTTSSLGLADSVKYAWNKGVVLVAAAGNYGATPLLYPAQLSQVIAVGATDGNNIKTSWSNYGSELDVMAPGVSINTTNKSGSYSNWSGTSFSVPQVSGLAALMLSLKPFTNQQVYNFITQTAVDLGSAGKDDNYGYGLINGGAALAMANAGPVTASSPTPTPTSTPTPTPTPTPTTDTTPPAVSITSPAAGPVSGNVQISANISDPSGISAVRFLVDGVLKTSFTTFTSSLYTYTWDSKTIANGTHTITVGAKDRLGNTKKVDIIVTVSN